MQPILKNIDSIIFDLGEVIVDVDTTKTVAAFESLGNLVGQNLFSFSSQALFFSEFEKGNISEVAFRDSLRNALNKSLSDDVIDDAWNAMLGNTPVEKLNILTTLQKNYQTFALSNTNSIHIRFINDDLAKKKENDCLENYFHQVFYSYHVGSRKPEEDIYRQAMKKIDVSPNRILMIDDRKENLETAERLGMQVFHLEFPNQFYEIFASHQNETP